MAEFLITAIEDEDHPEGGHAILIVEGVNDLPDAPQFLLRPVDVLRQSPAFDVWHRPLSHRATDDGVVFIVGTELVESPLFTAGTEFELTIDGVDGAGIFVWPSVTPLIRTKRKTLLTRGSLRNDVADETQSAIGKTAETPAFSAKDFALKPVIAEQTSAMSDRSISTAQARAADTFSPALRMASAQLGLDSTTRSRPDKALAIDSVTAATTPDLPAKPVQSTSVSPVSHPATAAAATACLLLAGQFYLFPENFRPTALPSAAPHFSLAPQAKSIAPSAVFELIDPGQRSPRGLEAGNVAPQRALELANLALQSTGAQKDSDEGAFWLKRFIVTAPGSDRLARAFTELGTIHAEQNATRAPEYVKARALWEIAAAMGDPGAAYFLGQLREFGLGVPQDPRAALNWYERARAQGTFPGVEDAIVRIRRTLG